MCGNKKMKIKSVFSFERKVSKKIGSDEFNDKSVQ